jgi:hypothetical protein
MTEAAVSVSIGVIQCDGCRELLLCLRKKRALQVLLTLMSAPFEEERATCIVRKRRLRSHFDCLRIVSVDFIRITFDPDLITFAKSYAGEIVDGYLDTPAAHTLGTRIKMRK